MFVMAREGRWCRWGAGSGGGISAGTRPSCGDVAFTTTCLSCGCKRFLVEDLRAISLSSFVFSWRGHGARVPSLCPVGVFGCWGRAGPRGAGGDGAVSISPSPQALFVRLFGLDRSVWIRFCLHCLWRCFPKRHRGGSFGDEKGKKGKKMCPVGHRWKNRRKGGRGGRGWYSGKEKRAACEHRPSCAPAAPLPPRQPGPCGTGALGAPSGGLRDWGADGCPLVL